MDKKLKEIFRMDEKTQIFAVDWSQMPTAPSPMAVTQFTALARHVVSLLAGTGFGGLGVATLTDSQLTAIVSLTVLIGSTVLWLGALVWSWWSDWKKRREDHAASVASAAASAHASVKAGQPVVVVVPPPPAVS
jgi:Flp pilus assembly protein TadB